MRENTFEDGEVGLFSPTPHTSPKGKRTPATGWGKSSDIRFKTFDLFKTQGGTGKTGDTFARITRRGKGERIIGGEKEEGGGGR